MTTSTCQQKLIVVNSQSMKPFAKDKKNDGYSSTTIAFPDIGDNMDIDLDEIGMYKKKLPQNG